MQEKLSTLKHKQEKDFTMCSRFSHLQKKEKSSHIVEIVQEIKKMTSKSSKVLETSESDSTLKDLTPYWNKSCEEMSKKLLSLTKTGSVDSDSVSSNLLQAKTLAESWFSNSLSSHLKPNLFNSLGKNPCHSWRGVIAVI